MTSIGSSAFEDCTSLNTVYCYAEEVPSASSQVFSNSPINTATLYVPASSIETYKSTSPWNEFNEIKALPASITLNKAQGTYCFDEDLDFSGVEGIRAYVASGFNPETGTLLLMHVDEVPANTGLLIKGTAGKTGAGGNTCV